jgi:hypothetical protein
MQTTYNQNRLPEGGWQFFAAIIVLGLCLMYLFTSCNTVKKNSTVVSNDSTKVISTNTVTVLHRDTLNNTVHEIEYVFQTDTVRVFDTVYLPGIGKVIAPRLKYVRSVGTVTLASSITESKIEQRKDSTQVKAKAVVKDKESKRPNWFGLLLIVGLIFAIIIYIGERKR